MQRTTMATLVVLGLAASAQGGEPKWKQHTINAKSEFEAAGVFDVDKDGQLDIVSGDTWYQGPDFQKTYRVRDVSRTGTYLNCFCTLPFDVNQDGWMDYITCGYFTKNVGWVENPKEKGKEWTYHEIDLPGTSEAAQFVDFNGDGVPEILPNSTNAVVFYCYNQNAAKSESGMPWQKVDLGQAVKNTNGHGVGSGDVNGDGRVDLLTPRGWWQNTGSFGAEYWIWHPDWNLGATGIQILARDVDGDGLADVVYGMGHSYGLYWLKQVKNSDGSRAWVKQPIDETIASVHTLIWADIDGDGAANELVTGKRVYAHEKEPGDTDGSVIAWYDFHKGAKPQWTRHLIFQGEPAKDAPSDPKLRSAQKDFPPGTAGTGLQVTAIDIDGDGDTDLVCPGKSGLYLFENLGNMH
jgi:uncharacterized protein (DUF3820 family)